MRQAFQVRDGRIEPITFFPQLSQHAFQIHECAPSMTTGQIAYRAVHNGSPLRVLPGDGRPAPQRWLDQDCKGHGQRECIR